MTLKGFFLLGLSIVSFTTFSVAQQKWKEIEYLPCTPQPKSSPLLLGFRLNMSKRETLRNLSGVSKYVSSHQGSFGLSSLKLKTLSSILPPYKFRGINTIDFDFLDEKLTNLKITYASSANEHLDNLLRQTLESLDLPIRMQELKSEDYQVRLSCGSFSLSVQINSSTSDLSLDSGHKIALERLSRAAKGASIELEKSRRERKLRLGFNNVNEKKIQCELSINTFPPIRDFPLRMSYTDALSKLTDVATYYSTYRRGNGVSVILLRFSKKGKKFYEVEDKGIPKALAGIYQMRLSFSKNKLFEVFVTYSDYRPKNLSDFMQQTSEKLGIPLNSWDLDDSLETSADAMSDCSDFKIYLHKNPVSFSLNKDETEFFPLENTPLDFYAFPSVRVLETETIKRLSDEEYKQWNANREQEKKVETEKRLKQKVFKP